MLKNKYIIILVSSILIIFSAIYLVNKSHNTGYYMEKLKNGNAKEKMRSAKFLGENKVLESIPYMVKELDNNDFAFPFSKAP